MNKLVSVAIVNWNGEKYLYKCIKSLLEQNYKNIEIIVIDNDFIHLYKYFSPFQLTIATETNLFICKLLSSSN